MTGAAKTRTGTRTLMLGMLAVMIGNGLLGTVLTLRASQMGMTESTIGLIYACNSAGCILGCLLASSLLKRLPHQRAMPLLGLFAAVAVTAPMKSDLVAVWIVSRTATGICLACLYVAAESWIASDVDPTSRRKSLSTYFAVQIAGMSVGQLILSVFHAADGFALFGVSVLFALAFLPLLALPHAAGKRDDTDLPGRKPGTTVLRVAPVSVVGAFVGGSIAGAMIVSLPLVGLAAGFDASAAALLVFLFTAGAAMAQSPAGTLSGRLGPRAALGVLALLVLPFSIVASLGEYLPSQAHFMAAIFFLGASTGPIYALCLGHLTNHLSVTDTVAATSTLTFFQASGWVVGPALGPMVLQTFGIDGFFGFIFAISTVWVAVIAASFLFQRPVRQLRTGR